MNVLRLDELVESLLVVAALCGAFVSNVVDLGKLLIFGLRTYRDLLFFIFHGLRVDRKADLLLRRMVIAATLSCDVHMRVGLNGLEVPYLVRGVIWTRMVVSSLAIVSIR